MPTSPDLKQVLYGRVPEIAARCGISTNAVYRWAYKGQIPAERVLAVESVTGVPRHQLRSDLYPTDR